MRVRWSWPGPTRLPRGERIEIVLRRVCALEESALERMRRGSGRIAALAAIKRADKRQGARELGPGVTSPRSVRIRKSHERLRNCRMASDILTAKGIVSFWQRRRPPPHPPPKPPPLACARPHSVRASTASYTRSRPPRSLAEAEDLQLARLELAGPSQLSQLASTSNRAAIAEAALNDSHDRVAPARRAREPNGCASTTSSST